MQAKRFIHRLLIWHDFLPVWEVADKQPAWRRILSTSLTSVSIFSISSSSRYLSRWLQVAVYTFLEELTGSRAPSDQAKALACQAAEHQFAGLPFYMGGGGGLTRAWEKDELMGPRLFSLSLKLLHVNVSVTVK